MPKRTAFQWRKLLSVVTQENVLCAVVYRAGEAVGYMLYALSDGTFNVQELLAQDAAAKTPDGDVWNIVKRGEWVTEALPIVAVLTNAATGSEMDAWAVISNMDTNEKLSLGGNCLIPRAAFENPEYSYSLPPYQTACGAFDIFNLVVLAHRFLFFS